MQPLEDWRNQLSSSKLSSPHSATGSKQFGNGSEKHYISIYILCNYLIMYIYHHKMVGSIPIILNMRHFMGRYIMRPPSGDGAFGVSAAFAASLQVHGNWWYNKYPVKMCLHQCQSHSFGWFKPLVFPLTITNSKWFLGYLHFRKPPSIKPLLR